MKKRLSSLVLGILLLVGCTPDPLTQYLNAKWPPVTIDEQRARTIETSVRAVNGMSTPNIMIGTKIGALEALLNANKELREHGIKKVKLAGSKQLLEVSAQFERQFKLGDNLDISPMVTGTIVVFAGVTGALLEGPSARALTLAIVPAFKQLKIESVKISGKVDVTPVGNALAAVLNHYADNITGELTRSPLTEVSLPASFTEQIDLTGPIKIRGQDGSSPDVKIQSRPVSIPFRLDGAALLIDDKYILAIAQASPTAINRKPKSSPEPKKIGVSYEQLQASFREIAEKGFGAKGLDDSGWVAVRKDLLADVVTSTFNPAKICIIGRSDIPRQEFSQKISFPNETSVDCTPTRNCTADRVCHYSPQHDDRSCSACLLRRPWDNGCVQRGNDPVCEFSKASQNKIYEADASAKKLDCERLKSQEKLQCEAEKTGEKALCETGKEALKRLARTGNFANLSGSAGGKGEIQLCFNNLHISEDLSQVHINIGVDGRANLDTSLKFTPLDIVGHLACQVPWSDKRSFTAAVHESSVPISSAVKLVEDDGTAKLRFAIAETKIPFRIKPGPTEWLLTNTNLTLSCAGLNLVKPLVILATPFIPELKGEFEHKEKAKTVELPIHLPEQKVQSVPVKPRIKDGKVAIIVSGSVE